VKAGLHGLRESAWVALSALGIRVLFVRSDVARPLLSWRRNAVPTITFQPCTGKPEDVPSRRKTMNVGEMMTRQVRTCAPSDSLNTAAQLMWENDCGAIPVVDGEGKAVAMITDRDICMAAYTQGQPLWNMLVSSAASHGIVTVRESESLDAVETLMQKHQIRRIPVVDAEGKPVGIVSMSDLARRAHTGHHKHNGLSADTIVRTLAAVCQPTPQQAHAAE